MAASACPDPELLGRWLAGDVGADERAAIADHAAECASCHRVIDAWCPPTADAGMAGTVMAAATGASTAEPPEIARADLPIGAQVDRYRIVRRLGSGGMGVVYVANDPELGRDVAIKLVRKGAPTERLAREAQALARLSHPNVVAVHDVGVHEGRTFIAMALVDGVDLRRWLGDPHTTAEILDVIRGAAAGVAAAHAAGLVHRDLKPDNIFVADDGRVLVGDFGLARELSSGEVAAPSSGDALAITPNGAGASPSGDRSSSSDESRPRRHGPSTPLGGPLTGTGTVLGTPAYMAPEQAGGEATAASDQFSLCVTAWEALYGARPFRGATLRQILARIKAGEISKPPRGRAPGRIERALRRGLSADPAARFASVDELMRAIAPRRARWPWIAGGIAAAAAAIAIGAFAMGGSRGAAAPSGPTCDDAARAIDGAWDAKARAQLEHAIVAPPGATAPPLVQVLDAYAARWRTARRVVCDAAARGEERAETTEQRVACLEARRASFARAIADATAAGANAFDAWRSAESLPDIDGCTSLIAIEGLTVPAASRAQVAQMSADLDAVVMRHAVSSAPQLPDVILVRQKAEQLAYLPLVVDALVVEGSFATDSSDFPHAEELLRRAIRTAEDAHYDLGRARAAQWLARVLIEVGRLDEASGMIDVADAANARAGGDPDAASELVAVRAKLAHARGDFAAAEALLRGRVDELRRRHGDDSILLASALIALAGEYSYGRDEAKAAEAVAESQAIFARHGDGGLATPETLTMQGLEALEAGDFARATDLDERALVAARAAGYPAAALAMLEQGLAQGYELAGRWREALAAYREAQALFEQVPLAERDQDAWASTLIGEGESSLALGDAAAAIAPSKAAIEILAKLGSASAAEDRQVTQLQLGHALVATGKMREARDVLEPTLRELRDAPHVRPQRIGSASLYLAEALWDDGDAHDRDRARTLADDAERGLTAGIADTADRPVMVTLRRILEGRLHELATWRARHP